MDTFQLKMQINTLTYVIRNNSNLSIFLNDKLLFLMNELTKETYNKWDLISNNTYREDTLFSLGQLSNYDGSNGKPAYVAIDGIVYDVSKNKVWSEGTHFGLKAGKDVTSDFNICHNNPSILDNFKKVGFLK